ncbi:nitrate- and nitrite sensing domain-containing protein [Streptomyces sp. NPDC046909]|uniref:nitrate- and nitrite sensing domain-containing protein n=1 Tax=Streptomyces sp. NPDC046909 TaxID=3155617 RepID=UPI0033ECD338
MQKTRPRRTSKQTAPADPATTGGAGQGEVGKGRPTHVRNRLIVAAAVVAAAIAGAGTPSVLAASGQLSDSQDLVTLAEQTQDALALAHSLADERDEVTVYVAAGRAKSKAPTEQRSARVDRQVEELRAETDPDIADQADLRTDLDGIAALRRAALTGKSGALEVHQSYSAAINELHRLAERLAEQMPPSAGSGAYALAELDSAVQQAAAARGLLLAALDVPRTTQTVTDPITGLTSTVETTSKADARQRDALTAAAQQARLRSDAALADFHDTAPEAAKNSYDSTVTGPEVNSAEKYLAALTDQPTLSDGELGTSAKKADAALSARVDLMRGVESALYSQRTKDLAQLRDDDVTALELRIAILGALMLLAVGIATAMARTLTRPLAVLRLGSARLAQAEDPGTEEPVKFTGRNDEFAQVVRSVNALHGHVVAVQGRITTLEADRKHLVAQRQKMADAREELRTELADSAAQLGRLRDSIGGTFVNLALRTLGLVERQLAVIEALEEREQDPDRLATLFKLDHFATVMRRHSENLLVLAGTEHVQQHAGPVPLVDVVRAAVSEIERYERVRIAALPPHAHVAGFAADDLSHLLAELMENATSFSPPDMPVEVSGWLLESGEVMLSVHDEGIGMTDERLTRLNSRLAEFDPDSPYDQEGEEGLGLGLYVVARLAHRHGVRVQLREQKQGGIAAVVVLPKGLLAPAPTAAVPSASSSPAAGTTPTFSLPGADAEANSNVLPGTRTATGDALVALAEQAVRRRETAGEESPAETTMELLAPVPTAPEAAPGPTAPEAVSGSAVPGAAPGPGVPGAVSGPAAPEAAPGPAAPGATPEPVVPGAAREPAVPGAAPEPATPDTPREPAVADGEFAPQGPPAPDDESSTGGAGGNESVEGEAETEHTRADDEDQLTAKGLPKRTPKITAPTTQAPRQRSAGVDAEALRRRLGGFRRGAEAGYRDVEAEIAEQTGQTRTPAHSEEATGGTPEEASS